MTAALALSPDPSRGPGEVYLPQPGPPRRRPASGTDDAVRFAEHHLLAWTGRPRTVMVTVPAPQVEAETLLDVDPRSFGFFWDGGDGTVAAGTGAAHHVQLSGPGRFRTLRRDAERAFRRLVVETHDGCSLGQTDRGSPRFYGGLAFDARSAVDEPWRVYGAGGFTLPRWLYRKTCGTATLSLAVRCEEIDAVGRTAYLEELERLLGELAARRLRPADGASLLTVERPPRASFLDEVEAIRQAIGEGLLSKVVAARRMTVRFPAPLAATAILRRLAGLPSSKRFAFRRGASTFLGATPERLVARRGRRIETEALAGTAASGPDALRLLDSAKDRREHLLVIEEIVRRLGPVCEDLRADPSPRVQRLRDVVHLRTVIDGFLREPCHVLDLAERLHPTPAVGGAPSAEAVRWIREHESAPRGWYAGPVGWFDAAGDGELAVALRSCLLRGREAHLYAGAGIVDASDPELEYAETELKMQTLLPALCA